jgi:hypothetical protein
LFGNSANPICTSYSATLWIRLNIADS